MISMRSSFRWWRENRWTEESALRAEGNSWWYLKGSRVRLTSGLLAPRHLDLMNAADQKECNPSRLHFHRSWRSERFMTAKFINAPPRKRLVEVNLVNAGSPEGGLRYCATLQATSEGKRSGLRDRLWALGASQTQLTRLSKRPWIDCRQPRLTISRYKGYNSA